MIKVSVVIPNFNGEKFLRICLPSLVKQTYQNFEVIIVDNGSIDDSVEYINKNFPKFKIIKLQRNYGFAKAVNAGIKKSKGELVFLLNNDTKVDKKCLKYLLESVKSHPEVGFIQAKIINFSNPQKIDSVGDLIDSVGHLYSRGFNQNVRKFTQAESIFLASGSGVLIRKFLFSKIGFFDEDFFLYMEDADFFLRAQIAGFTGWFEPEAKVYHHRMGTAKNNFEVETFKNLNLLILKNFPIRLILSDGNWLKIFLVHLNTLKYLVSKGYLWQTAKVEFYLIVNLGKTLKKRKWIQSTKKVSDQYTIDNIAKKKIKVGKLLSW